MAHNCFRYVLELFTEERSLGMRPVCPDWEPALEGVAFDAIRYGFLPPQSGVESRQIEPVWDGRRGPPYVGSFRAVVAARESEEFAREIPVTYLGALARQESAALVKEGDLVPGQIFQYRVHAFPIEENTRDGAGGFVVEEESQSLRCDESRLSRFVDSSWEECADSDVPGDLPTFVPDHLLQEATRQAEHAGGIETGGILVGRLHRDSTLGEMFLEVTAQIPAQHALAHSTKLTFTAETWAAARAAISLRGRDEMMIGWWHLHPDWCRQCPPENRRQCTLGNAFFSAEDVHLHRECFSRAYHVALLVTEKIDAGFTWTMFGWRRGLVEARSFRALDPGRASRALVAAATMEGEMS